MISISIKMNAISVDLSNDELEKRLRLWKPREPIYLGGALSKYRKLVSSAKKGAVTHEGVKLN